MNIGRIESIEPVATLLIEKTNAFKRDSDMLLVPLWFASAELYEAFRQRMIALHQMEKNAFFSLIFCPPPNSFPASVHIILTRANVRGQQSSQKHSSGEEFYDLHERTQAKQRAQPQKFWIGLRSKFHI